MLTCRDKMFADPEPRYKALTQREIHDKVIEHLDSLAMDIAEGNVRVETVSQNVENRTPHRRIMDREITTLEVQYRED